jgi:HAE1 family hydrophobic/amphiphilic exporter-1
MLPVAIGLGEGGEFYRPMAIAIIGGTITSTVLTLLMVPTFYDSIEIAKDSALAKTHRRAQRFGMVLAVTAIVVETLLFLVLARFVYRSVMKLVHKVTGRRAPTPEAPQEETRKIA